MYKSAQIIIRQVGIMTLHISIFLFSLPFHFWCLKIYQGERRVADVSIHSLSYVLISNMHLYNRLKLAEYSIIGKVQVISVDDDVKDAIGMNVEQASMFMKAKVNKEVYYSQRYDRLKSRNSLLFIMKRTTQRSMDWYSTF